MPYVHHYIAHPSYHHAMLIVHRLCTTHTKLLRHTLEYNYIPTNTIPPHTTITDTIIAANTTPH